jgi:hypothetical protein
MPVQAINALCRMWLPAHLDTSARQKVGPADWHCSSFITLKLSVLRPGSRKTARNVPKCHSSCLCRAGVFVPVVARPIQDMSEVSITHKTMGIRLPRLRRGAGLVCRPVDHPKRVSSSFFPFVHGGVAAGGKRSFRPQEKTEQGRTDDDLCKRTRRDNHL